MERTYAFAAERQTTEGHRLLIEAARVTPDGWPFNVYVYRSRLENGEAINPWTYGADSDCGLPTERKAISAVISKLLDIAEMLNAPAPAPAPAPALAPAPAPAPANSPLA